MIAGERALENLRSLRSETESAAGRRLEDLRLENKAGLTFLISTWRSIGNFVRLFIYTHPGFEVEVEQRLRNQEDYVAALVSGDPEFAERTFRSIILKSAFTRLGRAVPADFADLYRDPPDRRRATDVNDPASPTIE